MKADKLVAVPTNKLLSISPSTIIHLRSTLQSSTSVSSIPTMLLSRSVMAKCVMRVSTSICEFSDISDPGSFTDDIEAVFFTGASNISPAQAALEAEVMARWSAFARTGSPNAPRYVQWNPISASPASVNLNLLKLAGSSSSIASTQENAQCNALSGLWGRIALFDEQIYG